MGDLPWAQPRREPEITVPTELARFDVLQSQNTMRRLRQSRQLDELSEMTCGPSGAREGGTNAPAISSSGTNFYTEITCMASAGYKDRRTSQASEIAKATDARQAPPCIRRNQHGGFAMKTTMIALALLLGLAASGIGTSTAQAQGNFPGSRSWSSNR